MIIGANQTELYNGGIVAYCYFAAWMLPDWNIVLLGAMTKRRSGEQSRFQPL